VARIRNADRALIEAAKLRGYLLSRTHPVGRFKAIFFRSLGYSVSQWRRLEADLHAHLLENETESHEDTPYGRKFTVRGTLEGRTASASNWSPFGSWLPERTFRDSSLPTQVDRDELPRPRHGGADQGLA